MTEKLNELIANALANPTLELIYHLHADGSCTAQWSDGDKLEMSAEQWQQFNNDVTNKGIAAFSAWVKRGPKS